MDKSSWTEVLRRGLDVTVATGLLIALAPLFAVVAILVKVDSPGPALFRQLRVGKKRRPFRMLKFRSMTDGAETLRPELTGAQRRSPIFKLTDDPRLTRVGRTIRCLSLDELPQLVNVLRGDMALVGPRPLPVSDLRRFEETQRDPGNASPPLARWHDERVLVRPGLTGLWQINRRDPLDIDAWVEHDCRYVREQSLALDVAILLRTPLALARRNGAV